MPLPDPLAPEVTVIHVAALTAVHPQLGPVVTFTVPVPPDAGKEVLVGEMENEQGVPD